MKSFKSIFKVSAVLLLLVLVLFALVAASCDSEEENKKGEYKEEHLDDLPDDLDFGGEQVNIFYWGNSFVINELTADGSTGDVVDLAIDERNRTVEERLNVTLNPIQGDIAAEVFMPVVRDEIMSGSDDYDIILGPQCTACEVAAAGAFRDLKDAPYIDYSKDYWSDDYIQALSVNDKRFMIGGDVSLTTTAWTSTMLFYIDYFENTFGPSADLYDLILSGDGATGGWTIDVLSDYCRQSYIDLNGNGLVDNGDRFGTGITGTSSIIDSFFYSAGIHYSKRDANNVPALDIPNTQMINFFEKFFAFCWENQGVNMTSSEAEDEMSGNHSVFEAGTLNSIADMRGEEMDFGVIPFPKAEESMTKYHSWLSDNTVICAVPITEPENEVEMACATIECMASENNRICLPAYYETALKDKYTRDEYSPQMLDIIHGGETTDFVCTFSSSLNGIGGMMRPLIGYQESNLVSWYEARRSQVEASLQKLFEAFDQINDAKDFVPETTTTLGTDELAPSDLPENQISTNWQVFGTKYRRSQVLIKPDMSESFSYIINDNDEIEVSSPSTASVGGYNPTAVIQSRKTVPLAPLSMTFHGNEGFSYNSPPDAYSSAFSVVWTDTPITEIPNYLDGLGTNGLRACIPSGAYALVVSFVGKSETNPNASAYTYVILFDGTDTAPETDSRVGYRFTNKVDTDLSQEITVEVKEDDTLGYVVSVNGNEFRTGTRGSDTLDIDLSALKEKAAAGYIAIGGECAQDEGFMNFTLSTINGKSAGSYFD